MGIFDIYDCKAEKKQSKIENKEIIIKQSDEYGVYQQLRLICHSNCLFYFHKRVYMLCMDDLCFFTDCVRLGWKFVSGIFECNASRFFKDRIIIVFKHPNKV